MITTEIKLLSDNEKKDEAVFNRLVQITDESFEGVQCPPTRILYNRYEFGDVYVSRLTGIILGFAIVVEKNGCPYIFIIAVDSHYRGQSIGTQLLEAIRQTETMRRKDFIELAVKPDNPAQKLYFDAGYRVRAVARGFYGDEGDGLLMRRDL